MVKESMLTKEEKQWLKVRRFPLFELGYLRQWPLLFFLHDRTIISDATRNSNRTSRTTNVPWNGRNARPIAVSVLLALDLAAFLLNGIDQILTFSLLLLCYDSCLSGHSHDTPLLNGRTDGLTTILDFWHFAVGHLSGSETYYLLDELGPLGFLFDVLIYFLFVCPYTFLSCCTNLFDVD